VRSLSNPILVTNRWLDRSAFYCAGELMGTYGSQVCINYLDQPLAELSSQPGHVIHGGVRPSLPQGVQDFLCCEIKHLYQTVSLPY
jgi:hypothetical protein